MSSAHSQTEVVQRHRGGCWARSASLARPNSTGPSNGMSFGDDRRSLREERVKFFSQECIILRTNGFPPTEDSSGPSDEQEQRDDRAEMIAIAISLLLIISAFAVILGIVLLSRPLRPLPALWIPGSSALVTLSRGASSTTSSLGAQPASSGGPPLRGVHLWRVTSALLPRFVGRLRHLLTRASDAKGRKFSARERAPLISDRAPQGGG